MQNLWLILHSLIVMSGLAIYVVTTHTLHLRRHPSAAISWVASLILLPYIALPLYLMFGIRKVGYCRKTVKGRELPASDTNTLSHRTRQLAAVMALPEASSYQQLSIHENGDEALQALRYMIANAARTIDLCTFIFAHDSVGREISRSLMLRVQQGIRVRLLVDGVGAYLGGHTDFKSLSDAGVQVTFFVPPLRSSTRGRINLRNHRKMVIIDNTWLWCGGRNLATEYFESDTPWIDLSFDLRGALALQAQQQFEQDWAFAIGAGKPVLSQSTAAGPVIGQLIASGPDQMDDTYYTLLISGFFNARKRVMAVTPYFVPDPTLLMSLTLAARRGVVVDLLLPKKSNHRLADFARHRALRELTAAGAHVWFLPDMIHAKTVVIDDEIAFAGSANLDQRSLFLNYEMMIAFYEATDVKRFSKWIEHHMNAAAPYHARPPGIGLEVAEGLLLWLAFQL
ncbi:MAG: phospholipase D-like domain-containing protein [Gallionella sp.]|jgi:cardiolipin synthase